MRLLKYLLPLILLLCLAGSARAQFPCTSSANINFQIPNIGNTTNWGFCLNTDFQVLDLLLGGNDSFPTGTTAPSVRTNTNWVTANIAPVTIVNFVDAFPGQTIRILCGPGDTFTAINSNSHIALSTAWSCGSSKSLTLTLIGALWMESGRSGGGTTNPGSPNFAMQYGNLGTFFGSSLIFSPATSGTCTAAALGTCDSFTMSATSSCFFADTPASGTVTFGNSISMCITPTNIPSGGSSLSGFQSLVESELPVVGAFGFSAMAIAKGTGTFAIGMYLSASDEPLDTGTGQTIVGVDNQMSLTRATGSIAEVTGNRVRSPFNFATGGAPAAETATLLTGIHIQDQLAKGTTTAAILIDSQTSCAGCWAIKVNGGPTALQATTVSLLSASASGHCAINSSSPGACGAAFSGAFVIPSSATTYTVNSTAVTSTSSIILTPRLYVGDLPSLPTCTATPSTTLPIVSAIVPGVSFTITVSSIASQTCYSFLVLN